MTGEHRAGATADQPTGPVPQGRPESGGNRTGGPLVSLLILGLCALLGFGIATQVRRTAAGDTLATLRPDDLVQILDACSSGRTTSTGRSARCRRP